MDIIIEAQGAPAPAPHNAFALLRSQFNSHGAESGTLYGYGDNYNFNLGIAKQDVKSLTLIDTVKQRVKTAVSGSYHTLILTENNELLTCGHNGNGATGHADPMPQKVPKVLMQDSSIIDVDAGSTFSVILLRNGDVLTFGDNSVGQLGRKVQGKDNKPTRVEISQKVKQVAAGYNHLLLLTEDGTIYACGHNEDGQLGTGNNDAQTIPAPVTYPFGEKVKLISTGADHSACVTESGKLYVFGRNMVDQLGLGKTTVKSSNTPLHVSGISEPVTKLSCGALHTLALTTTGKLFIFGCYYSEMLMMHGGYPPRYPKPYLLNNEFKIADLTITDILGGNCSSYVFVRTPKGEQKLLISGSSALQSKRTDTLTECNFCGDKRIVKICKCSGAMFVILEYDAAAASTSTTAPAPQKATPKPAPKATPKPIK